MTATVPTPMQRMRALLQDPGEIPITRYGYLDLLGAKTPVAHTIGQKLMRSKAYSAIYEFGRPMGVRLLSGFTAPTGDEDRARIAFQLRLTNGTKVLDIGCGTGYFTGAFGSIVGPEGLAVGIDASHSMLRRAAANNFGPAVAYLRGDAEELPFDDNMFDAVSCLAALYLFNDPYRAIDEIARVLKPGGRVAILSSCAAGRNRLILRDLATERITGVRMFRECEITAQLSNTRFTEVTQQITGLTQSVFATKT